MLFFVNVRIDPKGLSLEELWDVWEKEAHAAIAAKAAGKIVNLWKVAGQRRVLAVLDVESHDEMDRIFMAALPLAHNLEFEQILPIREYERFAADVGARWKGGT
jgi:muconolactone delta-isomerase